MIENLRVNFVTNIKFRLVVYLAAIVVNIAIYYSTQYNWLFILSIPALIFLYLIAGGLSGFRGVFAAFTWCYKILAFFCAPLGYVAILVALFAKLMGAIAGLAFAFACPAFMVPLVGFLYRRQLLRDLK